MKTFIQNFRSDWHALKLGDFTPREIAHGAAIGTAVALFPTYGFAPFIVLLILSFFPHINKPAAFIALAVWNPVMQIPVYAMSFALGEWLFQGSAIMRYDFEILNQVFTFTRRFLIGHLMITAALTGVAYGVGYFIARLTLKPAKVVTEADEVIPNVS